MKYLKGKKIINIMTNDEKNIKIKNKLKQLPTKPGVYLMKDEHFNYIYIGKAIVLKNRVRQYFRKGNRTQRIENMISHIHDFEYIVTDTEDEALILEDTLVKKYRPKYNVLLKDDKTFPFIKLDMTEEYPTPKIYRTKDLSLDKNSSKAKYFGPYASPHSAKVIIELVKNLYNLRYCKMQNYKKKSSMRPCFYSHIGKCDGICTGELSKDVYSKRLKKAEKILKGNTKEVLKILKSEMQKASNNLNFEKAAEIRDKITSIQRIGNDQKVSNIGINSIDAIGLVKNEFETIIQVFEVRSSRLQGRKNYPIKEANDLTRSEITELFLKQNYLSNDEVPKKIMVKDDFKDRELLEKTLTDKQGYKVEIVVPKRGEKLRFVELAEENAKIEMDNKYSDSIKILQELKNVLNLKSIPKRIEAYDISNISGEFKVAGMAVLNQGKINRKLNRKFKIKTIIGQDDYGSMEEVILVRMKHNLDGKDGLGDFPDLIIADGGKGQIGAIKKSLKTLNLDIPVFGLVKDDRHKTRALISYDGEEFVISPTLNRALSNLQEEVHKLAIEYHRKLRDKSLMYSDLDKVSGIGEKKKKELLKTFGSVENIKKASIEELVKINGISEKIAQNILSKLNE